MTAANLPSLAYCLGILLSLLLAQDAWSEPSAMELSPEYAILAAEQQRALSDRPPGKFAKLVEDFYAFRSAVVDELRAGHAKRFSKKDLNTLAQALLEYGDDRQGKPPSGSPVFHSFHGHWRGEWFQDGEWTPYDHTWDAPQLIDGIVLQLVEIGEWDGSRRVNPTPAINSYDPETGSIAGAVGLSEARPEAGTDAPHWGIWIDDRTIIWLAQFGPRDGAPYYSVYYEQIVEADPMEYRIRGIGFNWDPSLSSGGLVAPHWKEGLYRRVDKDPESLETEPVDAD